MGKPKTRKFRTEMTQLMEIIVHSLYSNKEIFLRELISNSVDAIDKVRFEGLTNSEILEDNNDWKIKIIADKEKGTLTVSDNGNGMSFESISDQLGTIAKSGTADFLEKLKEANQTDRPELIGQFGVGFYSSFMVADKVTVISRTAGDPSKGVIWESQGKGTYTIDEIEKERRGTKVILHLKDDEKDFLDEWQIKSIVKKFSDFVEHPIVMDVEKGDEKEKTIEEETLNSQKAIWLRSKNEIKEDEYSEFYKHLTRDFEAPMKTIHFVAEGQLEYRALLFIPSQKPPAFMIGDLASQGPQLYVRRVFITDSAEAFLPPYLRFIRGVVESSDLQLNVSREMLQDSPIVNKIQKGLVTKILQTLEEMARDERAEYEKFFKVWSPIFKSGIYVDFQNRERLADLLLYESTKTDLGQFTTLPKYVEAMGDQKKDIYYLIGPSRETLDHSPYLEAFKENGSEVLLMTDPIDEWVTSSLGIYKGKNLKAADKGELNKDEKGKDDSEDDKKFKSFLDFLNEKIDEVKGVRLSSRLTESAVVLVVEEGDMGAHMRAVLKEIGQDDLPNAQRTLELNPKHPTIIAMQELFIKDKDDPRLENYGRLLFDQAMLAQGAKVDDPVLFSKRINDLITKDAKQSE